VKQHTTSAVWIVARAEVIISMKYQDFWGKRFALLYVFWLQTSSIREPEEPSEKESNIQCLLSRWRGMVAVAHQMPYKTTCSKGHLFLKFLQPKKIATEVLAMERCGLALLGE